MPEWQTERDKKNKFLHWLRSNGFLVVTKEGAPGDGKHYKANVGVLMAIDAAFGRDLPGCRSLGDRRCRLRASSIAAPPARDSGGSSGDCPNTWCRIKGCGQSGNRSGSFIREL
jgi:hypothetical protein